MSCGLYRYFIFIVVYLLLVCLLCSWFLSLFILLLCCISPQCDYPSHNDNGKQFDSSKCIVFSLFSFCFDSLLWFSFFDAHMLAQQHWCVTSLWYWQPGQEFDQCISACECVWTSLFPWKTYRHYGFCSGKLWVFIIVIIVVVYCYYYYCYLVVSCLCCCLCCCLSDLQSLLNLSHNGWVVVLD